MKKGNIAILLGMTAWGLALMVLPMPFDGAWVSGNIWLVGVIIIAFNISK